MIRRTKQIVALVYLIAVAAWLAPGNVQGQPAPKAIVLAWDGAVPSFVHELLQHDKLPNLAKLIKGGVFADNVLPVFPSKTAPGFAALLTGAQPRVNGISGNRIPRAPQNQFTILESSASFNSELLRADPLWASAERAGLNVIVAHFPLGGDKSERGVHMQGYSGLAGSDGVLNNRNAKPRLAVGWDNLPQSNEPPLEISFTIGATFFFGLFIDDPADPQLGYDTLWVTTTRNGQNLKARLKPGLAKSRLTSLWSGVIDLITTDQRRASIYLRLFDLQPDGSDFMLYFTRPTREIVSPTSRANEVRTAAGIFVGNGASDLYSEGAFGATIPKGGNGIAESRYLETVALAQHQLIETNRWALKRPIWNLILAYTPFPDEAEHLWRGYLDSTLPGYRKDIADHLRPFLAEVYQSCDEFLGLFLAQRPDNTVVALISDHGMEGVDKFVSLNRALKERGLLVTDGQGRIDLGKTKAFYPAINSGYVLINSTDRKNGIVSPGERAEVVRQIRAALFDLRDGDHLVVTDVIDAQTAGAAMGIGGETGGDIYVDLLPGYDFDAATGAGAPIRSREPHGNHGFNPLRVSMRTIMVLNGPGIALGQQLRGVRIIDFAPTLAKLLRIPPLKDATGRVIEEALMKP